MPNFIHNDFNQNRLVSISYCEQLLPDTFEHTLWHIVHECLDFSAFSKRYKNDRGGRAAYDPAILFTVVVFGYYRGINTSRRLARACRENVIFGFFLATANHISQRLLTLLVRPALILRSFIYKYLKKTDEAFALFLTTQTITKQWI